MSDIALREPLIVAAGDSLEFQRTLRDYLPSAGWSLTYLLRAGNGEVQVTVNSTASGDAHLIDEDAFAAGIEPGDYVLAGFAVNGAERHQIYLSELTVTADLGSQAAAGSILSHTQRMIPLLEAQLERLAANELDVSNVQQVELRRVQRLSLEKQLAINKELRANEIAQENMRNGRGSGNIIRTRFDIT